MIQKYQKSVEHEKESTVVPSKSDSDVIFCLQL